MNLQNSNQHKANLINATAQNLEFKAFRDFTPEDDVLIFKIKLDICSLLVTEKNMEQAHQVLMIQFLKNEFQDMSPYDIQNAVQKYLGGKLECCTKFCTKMSAEFMGVILRAYRIYKREKQAENRMMIPIQAPTPEQTPQQNLQNLIQYVQKNNTIPEWGSNIFLSAYKAIDEPTKEEKFIFAEKVKQKLNNEINVQKTINTSFLMRATINDLKRSITIPRIFANVCKVEYMKQFLTLKYIKL
jgi:hypothetical protein